MKRGFAGSAALASAILLLPHAAQAHIVGARLGDFYAGGLHPLTDLQDGLLWGTLGILAGSLGAQRARWLVLLFPAGLLIGLVLGLQLGVTSAGLAGDAAATIALGLLLATAMRLPARALGALALCIGVVRGAVNAGGAGPETNTTLFGAGLAAAGYIVITLTMALTIAFTAPAQDRARGWRLIALRACGSWIAAIGLMMGGFALANPNLP